MSVRIKVLRARVKLFFTRPRFVKQYSTKKRLLALFLVVVNVFVGWNLSLHLPAVEVKVGWTEPIVITNEALAFKEEEPQPVVISDCEEAIEVHSAKYGAPKDLMQRIMDSESGNDNTAENGISTATGCFQWVIGSWRSYGKELWKEQFYEKNIYNPSDNVELAAYVISEYGTGDWNASKHAWGR